MTELKGRPKWLAVAKAKDIDMAGLFHVERSSRAFQRLRKDSRQRAIVETACKLGTFTRKQLNKAVGPEKAPFCYGYFVEAVGKGLFVPGLEEEKDDLAVQEKATRGRGNRHGRVSRGALGGSELGADDRGGAPEGVLRDASGVAGG